MDEQIFNVQFVLSIFLFCMVASRTWRRKLENKPRPQLVAATLGAIDPAHIGNCDGWRDREWRNLQSQAKAS